MQEAFSDKSHCLSGFNNIECILTIFSYQNYEGNLREGKNSPAQIKEKL